MRYDLIVGNKVVGVISLTVEVSGAEHWLLEIDAYQGQQVSVKFNREDEAHHLAEEWANVQQRVERIAATMQRSGTDFVIR